MRTDTHPASHGYSEDRVPSLDVAPAVLQGEETRHQLGRGPEPGGGRDPPELPNQDVEGRVAWRRPAPSSPSTPKKPPYPPPSPPWL